MYKILLWVQHEGKVKAMSRLKIRILPDVMREGILLREVNPHTSCSDDLLVKLRREASAIVGKPCPF